jgi:hypothetical protein
MRPLQIMGSGIIGLVVVFWLTLHPVQALTAVALMPFLLLAIGQFYLPNSKRAIQVWFDPKILVQLFGDDHIELPVEQRVHLSGRILSPSYFKQWHEFQIVSCRYWLLLILGAASLGGAGAIQSMKDFPIDAFSGLYWGAWLWAPCVLTAWRWLWERRTLRMSGIAVGSFEIRGSHLPPMRQIRYHFVDLQGEYHGGCLDSLFCDQSDDLTLVFYNEEDPNQNVPASAMIFHKLLWMEASPTSARSAGTGSSAGAGGQ